MLVAILLGSTLALAKPPAGDAEIEALITRVAQARDVVFIRNGGEHSAREAATHLRRKLAAAHGRITTAEQFIDALGTRSSLTGTAYRVRLPGGREVESALWLRQLLRDMRAADDAGIDHLRAPPPAAPIPSSPVPATQ